MPLPVALARELGRSRWLVVVGASDCLEALGFTPSPVGRGIGLPEIEDLRPAPKLVARLGEREVWPSLADDAAVEAVAAAGRRFGRVGDFGAGLTKPPVEVCVAGFLEVAVDVEDFEGPDLAAEVAVGAVALDFSLDSGAIESLLVFRTGAFAGAVVLLASLAPTGCLGEAGFASDCRDDLGCDGTLGVVGVFRDLSDFVDLADCGPEPGFEEGPLLVEIAEGRGAVGLTSVFGLITLAASPKAFTAALTGDGFVDAGAGALAASCFGVSGSLDLGELDSNGDPFSTVPRSTELSYSVVDLVWLGLPFAFPFTDPLVTSPTVLATLIPPLAFSCPSSSSTFCKGVDVSETAVPLMPFALDSALKLGVLGASLPPSPTSLAFLRPNIGPNCPLFSTATKLVLTFEIGLEEELKASELAGDLPLDGGDVSSALASNMARMLRTPPLPARSPMAATRERKRSVHERLQN